MGKFLRHGIGALVGSLIGTVVAWLAAQGVEVDSGTAAEITAYLTNGLVLFASLLGYATVEKLLKRFPGLDLEGYIDRTWLRREAGKI